MDDASAPTAGDAEAESGIPPLDRLLRPPDRVDAWRAALALLRGVDRRFVVGVIGALVVVAGVVAVVASRSSAPSDAQVTLPRARSDGSDTGGSSGAGSGDARSADDGTGAGGAASGSTDASGGVTTTSGGPVVVDVAGAVIHPGLVTVATGARVADAVSAAGGFRPDADVDRLNLASPLADGARVYVAAVGQSSIPVPLGASGGVVGGGDPSGAGATTIPPPVDLNTATADQLDALPGVGPSTAQAIIAYRTAHGSFASVDDLDQVRGIGPGKMSQLRDLVTVG